MDEKSAAGFLREKGWGLVPPDQYLIDMEPEFLELWENVRPYTMTSPERGYALYKAVVHLVKAGVSGDFVECGVWRGGSCMLICLVLLRLGIRDRKIYLYDTFAGMPRPGDEDVIAWNNLAVSERIARGTRAEGNPFDGWAVELKEVEENLLRSGYPRENLIFVPGRVEDTLKTTRPDSIALLRLDTDWYASTKAELEALYPRLVSRGILIIDDYGHFKGARKASDEYFASGGPYLGRIDYTGRIALKP